MPEPPINLSRVNIGVRRGPVYFGDVVYKPGGECGPRVQRDYQLVILRSGSLDLELNGRPVSVPPGAAILLRPGHHEHFRFAKHTETHHAWCAVAPGAVPAKLRQLFSLPAGKYPDPVHFGPDMQRLLELGFNGAEISGADSSGEDAELAYYLALGLAILCEAARQPRGRKPGPPHAEKSVTRACEFIRQELARPLTLPEIARAAGVSRQHLLKLFRDRQLGTPMEMLYRTRLETAAGLLTHTGLAIAEIADRTGFANAFHFSRKFKEVHGLSPRAWRSRLWNATAPNGQAKQV